MRFRPRGLDGIFRKSAYFHDSHVDISVISVTPNTVKISLNSPHLKAYSTRSEKVANIIYEGWSKKFSAAPCSASITMDLSHWFWGAIPKSSNHWILEISKIILEISKILWLLLFRRYCQYHLFFHSYYHDCILELFDRPLASNILQYVLQRPCKW